MSARGDTFREQWNVNVKKTFSESPTTFGIISSRVACHLTISGIWYIFFLFIKDLKQVPRHFICSGECCYAILLWSSRNVLWTTKLHLTLHQHEGEWLDSKFLEWTVPLIVDWTELNLQIVPAELLSGWQVMWRSINVQPCYTDV